jgi:hypothetical protein
MPPYHSRYPEHYLRLDVRKRFSRAAGYHAGKPILDESASEGIATDLQPERLQYRLRNYLLARTSGFDAPDLTPAMRELARGLGAALVDDGTVASEVVSLLRAGGEDE